MNIKELRKSKNLSQQELSDRTGIPKARINAWEQGKGNPKVKDAKILEQFFNIKEEQIPHLSTFNEELYAQKSKNDIEESELMRELIQVYKNNMEMKDQLIRLLQQQIESLKKENELLRKQKIDS